jgi:hypothetical protein
LALIGLDGEELVAFGLDDLLGDLGLRADGINGDNAAFDLQQA